MSKIRLLSNSSSPPVGRVVKVVRIVVLWLIRRPRQLRFSLQISARVDTMQRAPRLAHLHRIDHLFAAVAQKLDVVLKTGWEHREI